MKRFSLFLVFPLALLALACWAQAGRACGYASYSAFSYGYQTYQAPVYKQALVTYYQPVAALFFPVPTYSAGYVAPAASAKEVESLKTEIEKLKQQLTPPAPLNVPPKEVLPPPAAYKMPPADYPQNGSRQPLSKDTLQCAACHDARTSAVQGGGTTLFENDWPVKMDEASQEAVIKSVLSGKMPKCKGCQALPTARRSRVIAEILGAS